MARRRILRFDPRVIAIGITLAAVGFATNPDSRVVAPAELEATSAEPAAPAAPTSLAEPASSIVTTSQIEPAPAVEPATVAEPTSPEVLDVLTGSASYYANSLAGRRTASGVRYDPRALVAAHRTLPFGTVLRVTNPANDRTVEVRVVDRGPFAKGRVLDLSRRAAEQIGMIRSGHANVRIEVLSYGG